MTDSILEKFSDDKIEEMLLTNSVILKDTLERSLRDLIANRRKELHRRIAAYPVSSKTANETTNLFLMKHTEDEIDKMLLPLSDTLDETLKSCLFARFFR